MPEQSWLDSAKEKAGGVIDSVKSTAQDAYKTSKEYLGKAVDKITGTGQTMDEKSDGWLGNNKGLVIGGIVALLAAFGMQGGSIWQPLIAVGALLSGVFFDKDNANSLSGKMFGQKNEETPSSELGKERTREVAPRSSTPSAEAAVPPLEHNPHIANPKLDTSLKSNSFALPVSPSPVYISDQGEVVFNPPKMANLMKIVVDRDGKATAVAVADGNGDFVKNKDGNIINNKVTENIQFKAKPDDKGVPHVYVTNPENLARLIELRKIGTEALLKSKGIGSSSLDFNNAESASLGTMPSPLFAGIKDKQNFIS